MRLPFASLILFLFFKVKSKATEKGIYRLYLAANPKPGYEFSEDAKVYVGGQLQEDAYVYGSRCSVGKYYIVGLQEISKVELTFAEPQRAPAKGQSAVMYDGDTVIGGGIIQ